MSSVLIVHADGALGARFAAAISRAGHEVHVATSGERGMDRFIQEPADVVVIDHQLDGRDGLSTAEAIRWMPGGRRARVVLTAQRDPEGPSSLEELGRSVDAFATLVGPPDPARVASVVEEAAAVRPDEAETRVLTVEQVLLAAERARSEELDPRDATVDLSAATPEDHTLDEPDRRGWEWRDTDGRLEGREVRAMAEAAAHDHSDLVGSFDAMPFARVLNRLAQKRATGALICVHPPDERATTEGTEPTKIVYVRAGVPVHVRSNLVGECLGQVLARQQKIGPATLRESLSALQRGEGRQGELLVRMGALGPLDLSEGLAEQLRVKLFELFSWLRGTFRFAADRSPPDELIDLGLGLAEIAVLGVREGMPPARVLERLAPHRSRYVVPRPRELVRFVRLHVPEPLGRVIRAIDGSRTLRELLEGSGDPGSAAQLVYAMECLDAVRFDAQPLRARIAPVAAAPTPAEPEEDESWVGSTPLDEVSLEEDARWLTEPSAARVEPSGAGRATRVLHADEIDPPPPVAAEALEGDEDERRAGDPPAPITHTDPQDEPPSFGASLLEVAPPAPSSAARAAPVLPPTSPERPAPKSSGSARLPSDPPERGPVQTPPHEGPLYDRRAEGDPPPDDGSGLRKKDREASDPAVLDERVERLLTAERHFRRGQRALDRAKHDEAAAAFARAAELCPEEGQFLAYLGWAKHASAPGDALALSEAIELAERGCCASPELSVAHLLRARLLATARREQEAREAFARVLELDPTNEEAARAASG